MPFLFTDEVIATQGCCYEKLSWYKKTSLLFSFIKMAVLK
jgi:hypothetical protein